MMPLEVFTSDWYWRLCLLVCANVLMCWAWYRCGFDNGWLKRNREVVELLERMQFRHDH